MAVVDGGWKFGVLMGKYSQFGALKLTIVSHNIGKVNIMSYGKLSIVIEAIYPLVFA